MVTIYSFKLWNLTDVLSRHVVTPICTTFTVGGSSRRATIYTRSCTHEHTSGCESQIELIFCSKTPERGR